MAEIISEQLKVTKEERKVMIASLPRTVPVFEEPTPESERIAKRASRVLDYKGLLTFNAGGKLQAVLENLEIEVLDPKAVFEYQSKFGEAELNTAILFYEEESDSDDDSDEEDEDDEDEAPRRRYLKRRQVARTRSTPGYAWHRIAISKYLKAIPEFVVNKAIQIKEALPEVKIFVEELQYDPDPFLVVTCENDNFTEQYYVEVWEEPLFEGRFMSAEKQHPKKSK